MILPLNFQIVLTIKSNILESLSHNTDHPSDINFHYQFLNNILIEQQLKITQRR